MKRETANRITMDIRKLSRIIKHGENVAFEAERKRELLNNDRDHTDAWKKPHYETITRVENKQLRELGKSAQVCWDSILAYLDNLVSEFDYTDPALQTALSTINALGDKLPFPVQKQIVERFRGNPTALDMLFPLYEKHGYGTQAIKDLKSPLQNIDYGDRETIGEFIGYATSDMIEHNTWNARKVKRLLASYEKSLGLDSSANPYIREIDNLYNSSKDPAQRARINTYRRKYGEQLATDDPDAIEEAERQLASGFSGPVI
jgi:hypothetical protein